MKIKKGQIKAYQKLSKRFKELEFIISEQVRTAQDQNGNREVKLKREGKNIKLMERILWDEALRGGSRTQAWQELKNIYPEIFKLVDEKDKVSAELNIFTTKNWGFFWNQMNLSILIDLVKALIKYTLNPLNWF